MIVLFFIMSTNFSLFCHVLGTNHRDGFLVKIAASELVAELVSLIKAEKSIGGEISLWKVEIPHKEFEEKIGAYEFDEAQKLPSFSELSDVFPTSPPRGAVNIVVKNPELSLFCHVLGTNHKDRFPVKIAASELVAQLMSLIKAKKSIGGEISLWKVEIPHKEFGEKIGAYEFDEAQELLSFDELLDVFPTPPPRGAVHIVAKPLHVDAPAEPPTPAQQVLSLRCHILDIDPRDHFSIDAETSWTILTLENHIKEVGANRLVGVDTDYLALWKVSIPIDPCFENAVDECDFDEEEPLAQEDKLSDVFPTAPPKMKFTLWRGPILTMA
ncbi:hypothetical protein BD779DRAFT_555104 [Infundibulicybe gibba]|nr:hypothetical protein BD779DRAFT_555104 [Infundibulicybe gibba]